MVLVLGWGKKRKWAKTGVQLSLNTMYQLLQAPVATPYSHDRQYLQTVSWRLSFSINLTLLRRGILNWGIGSMMVCSHDSGSIFLIVSWCRWVQSTVGGTVPTQVDLGWKWAVSKLRFSALVPTSGFLSSGNLNWENLFPSPNCFWSECFLSATERQMEHLPFLKPLSASKSACVDHSPPVAYSPAHSIPFIEVIVSSCLLLNKRYLFLCLSEYNQHGLFHRNTAIRFYLWLMRCSSTIYGQAFLSHTVSAIIMSY